jgi:hypothetical protein
VILHSERFELSETSNALPGAAKSQASRSATTRIRLGIESVVDQTFDALDIPVSLLIAAG